MNSRRIRGVALVLCTAAIAAPAAQATCRGLPCDRPPQDGLGHKYEHGRGGASSRQPLPMFSYPRGDRPRTNLTGTDWATYTKGDVVPQPSRAVVIDRRPIVLESGGFDRADAGIGAAGAAGLLLVGCGPLLLARRGRRGHIANSE